MFREVMRVKLGHIEKHRTSMLKMLDDLEAQTKGVDEMEKITTYFNAFHKLISFPDLNVFVSGSIHDRPTQAAIQMWSSKIDAEVVQIRARLDASWIYSKLLGEWEKLDSEKGSPRVPKEDTLAPFYKKSTYTASLEKAFSCPFAEELKKVVSRSFEKLVKHKVPANEMVSTLGGMRSMKHLATNDCQEAINDEHLKGEIGNIVSLMVKDIADWNWSGSFPVSFVLNTDRVQPKIDVTTSMFLEYIGFNLGFKLHHSLIKFYASNFSEGSLRVEIRNGAFTRRKLIDLDDPFVEFQIQELQNYFDCIPKDYKSLSGGYNNPGSKKVDLLGMMSAIIKVYNKGTFIKTDLKQFGPSISHDLIINIVTKLGFPDAWVQFIDRYLKISVSLPGQEPKECVNGVWPSHALSMFLSELVLMFLDIEVKKKTKNVLIFRNHDDVFMWAEDTDEAIKAFDTYTAAAKSYGLEISLPKTGATVLHKTKPSSLPSASFGIGGLDLQSDGTFVPSEAYLEKEIKNLKRCLDDKSVSIMSYTRAYNSCLKKVVKQLGLPSRHLGIEHAVCVINAVRRINEEVSGDPRSIVPFIKSQIQERFNFDLSLIPFGWYHWPLSAGGLALDNPYLESVMRHYALQEHIGDETETVNPSTGHVIRECLKATEIEKMPEESDIVKAWFEDFKKRTSGVFGKNSNLRAGWKWLICEYGEEIMRTFGRFDFLAAEFVSVSLILRLQSDV